MRPLSYTDTDVWIICVSISDQESMNDIPRKWIPEIRRGEPKNHEKYRDLELFTWDTDIPIVLWFELK